MFDHRPNDIEELEYVVLFIDTASRPSPHTSGREAYVMRTSPFATDATRRAMASPDCASAAGVPAAGASASAAIARSSAPLLAMTVTR
jgi:hypothetical protein